MSPADQTSLPYVASVGVGKVPESVLVGGGEERPIEQFQNSVFLIIGLLHVFLPRFGLNMYLFENHKVT